MFNPFNPRRLDQSCALTAGMADRLGYSFPDALARDAESQAAAYRSAVLACAGCAEQGRCQKLQSDNDRLMQAPPYCRNNWG